MSIFSYALFITTLYSVCGVPVSQPIYQNAQYSPQVLTGITYKQPTAGFRPQIVLPQQDRPVYEGRTEGLQYYSSQRSQQPQQQPQQAIQQVLLATNVDRQKPPQPSGGPLFLHQVLAAKQQHQGQAQEAFVAPQRKIAPNNLSKIQPVLQAQQFQPQVQYSPQPPQYQPQPQYQPRSQPQPQQARREDEEDYDPNPSYQFGFNVKDDDFTNYQNRNEQREGNKITGSYSVVDSDGFIRTVQYTADPKEGFKAEVTRQPTDIVVKIPKPDPRFQQAPQPQYTQEHQPQQQRGQQYVEREPTQQLAYKYQ